MNCEQCKYFKEHGPRGIGHKQGACLRYPLSQWKMKTEWCGEYRANRKPKAGIEKHE